MQVLFPRYPSFMSMAMPHLEGPCSLARGGLGAALGEEGGDDESAWLDICSSLSSSPGPTSSGMASKGGLSGLWVSGEPSLLPAVQPGLLKGLPVAAAEGVYSAGRARACAGLTASYVCHAADSNAYERLLYQA